MRKKGLAEMRGFSFGRNLIDSVVVAVDARSGYRIDGGVVIPSLWLGSATGFCAVFAFSAIEMVRGCDVGIANDPFAVCFFASIVAGFYGLPVGICTALIWWKLRGRVHFTVPIVAVLAAIVVSSLLPAHHVPGNCVI